MSVQELRRKIEKLSSEIDIQKKLLATLERDKILFQRQLNAVLDPVARLPLEISSEIFLQSLAPFPEPGAHNTPMLLLSICHAWSNIALSTPSLWAVIDIVLPRAECFQEVLKIWLRRARNCPLSISLRGDLQDPSVLAIAKIIWQHEQRLRSLRICADEEIREDDDRLVDLFVGVSTPESLPLLETLTIRGRIDEWDFSGSQILNLLRLAPNLQECVFLDVEPVYHLDFEAEKLVLPNLRRLTFGTCTESPNSDDDLLKCLSLPGLEALSVSLQYVSADDLFSFFERSSPPLRELVLGRGYKSRGVVRLDQSLRLVPSLIFFDVWCPNSALMRELFASLEDSSFLPNLRNLTIHYLDVSDISDSSWETLLLALLARRNQLQVLRLELDEHAPPAGVLASMKELVADGMQIYMGTEECNFIVT
ncbi:F-box domain-containing protein [Mycena venus]|uniref:F-box domain-containing protein n=1 Tax=Mycena venus TaxID=2733690 RepID=A0A8H6U302_9AGAR|nr:F-box domain-containing protein [Mycena venus]